MNERELEARIERLERRQRQKRQDELTLLAVAGVGYLLWRWLWS
jgi:hypothetical protein